MTPATGVFPVICPDREPGVGLAPACWPDGPAHVHDLEVVSQELDFTLLPDELLQLTPLISRYAESDDADRSELLEQASDADLRELSRAPDGHWEAINAFLDENVTADPGPAQDVALALDSFSQAAMEAKYELERRDGG